MSLGTYSDLLSELADWTHRTDLSSKFPLFIQLAESDMQIRCKLVQFEASSDVAITSALGSIPDDFAGMRSAYWDGDENRVLTYTTPEKFDLYREETGTPYWYTITGSQIKVTPSATGTLTITYMARFTAIDANNPSNSLLVNYPDAYLYGSLVQFAIYCEDDAALQKYNGLFDAAIERIRFDNSARKYAGATLHVRTA